MRITTAINILVIVGAGLLLFGIAFGPSGGLGRARENAALQTARSIELALSAYAQNHNGHYPEGKTSTDVFQQLIDGNYVSDSSVFYLGFLHDIGKLPPQSSTLKQENVCFDVTCCADSSSPDNLPVVFLTGYKVKYQAGASAIPVRPLNTFPQRTWCEWYKGVPLRDRPFIVVSYKDTSATSLKADANGSISNFIPADFDPKGKTYRQLTP